MVMRGTSERFGPDPCTVSEWWKLTCPARSGTDPEAPGDMVGELQVFLDAGMDGFFTDNPDLGVAALGR